MKKTLMAIVALVTFTASANAMSYEQARREALFLTDKMAYELNLNDSQYDAAYEINLDYLKDRSFKSKSRIEQTAYYNTNKE